MEEVLLQCQCNHQAAVISVKAVKKCRKTKCLKLLRFFEEKRDIMKARDPTD